MLRLTLFAIFEPWFFVSSAVLKIPPERKARNRCASAFPSSRTKIKFNK